MTKETFHTCDLGGYGNRIANYKLEIRDTYVGHVHDCTSIEISPICTSVYVYAGMCDATYLSSCYIFVTDLLNWESARSRCHSKGGHLATIDSQEEKNVIHRMVNSKF